MSEQQLGRVIRSEDESALLQTLRQEVLQRLERIETKVGDAPKRAPVDWYKRVLDTIQVCVIAIGLVFTGLQVWRLQESTDLGAWNSVSTEWLKVDEFFVKNPELKKYFYDRAAVAPEDPDYAKIESVANYVLNFLDYAISTSDHIVSKYPEAASFIQPEVWKSYVRLTYFQSPAVCGLLRKLGPGYSKATREMGSETCPKT